MAQSGEYGMAVGILVLHFAPPYLIAPLTADAGIALLAGMLFWMTSMMRSR